MIINKIICLTLSVSMLSMTAHSENQKKDVVDIYSTAIEGIESESDVGTDEPASSARSEILKLLAENKRSNQNYESYNQLADDLEEDPNSVFENLINLVRNYGASGAWFLMQGVKAQLDLLESIKQQSDKEDVFGNTLMMGISVGFMPVGLVMMWPGLKGGIVGIKNISENRAYKKLLAERTRVQGKIEKLNADIKMRLSIEKVPQELRSEIVESQNKSAKQLFNDNQEKISKARESLSQLEKRVVELDEKIRVTAPVPRVSNFKSKIKNSLKIALKSTGFVAGAVVFQQSTLAANIIILETDDPLAGMKYYSFMKSLYQDLSELHQELTQN